MSHVVENVVSMLEEKIRTDTATEEEYNLYIEYRHRDDKRVFVQRKYEDLWQELLKEARRFG